MEVSIADAIRIAVAALVRGLPSWIVRRWYPEHRIAARFGVDLMSVRRLDFRFGTAIPELAIAFRYTNLNPFPVRVERTDFEIWVGQPIVKNAQVFKTRTVPPYATDPPVRWDANHFPSDIPPRFEFQLDPGQVQYVQNHVKEGRLANNIVIQFDVYGSALGRPFSKLDQRIEVSRDELPAFA